MGAHLRTFALFALLTGIFVFFGYVIGTVWLGDWVGAVVTFLLLAGAMNAIAYFASGRIVLWSYRAKLVTEAEVPKLYHIVREITLQSNLPMPKVAIVPTQTPNAFATGRNPKHAVVAVTQGILSLLSEDELRGVLAHEISHVGNRDILVMSVAATLAGAISFMARMFGWNMLLGGGSRDRNGNAITVSSPWSACSSRQSPPCLSSSRFHGAANTKRTTAARRRWGSRSPSRRPSKSWKSRTGVGP